MRPRAIKILRDLRLSYGRVAVMVIAIAVAVTGFGTILVAKESLGRDAAAAYEGTNPAAATLDLPGGVTPELLTEVLALPGVADATARQTVTTRVRVGDDWLPLLLFVVSPDDPMRIAHFEVESGTWPSLPNSLVIERAAVELLEASTGDELRVETSSGSVTTVAVAGTVWDPALAPAAQERTGYAFVTPDFVTALGLAAINDRLLFTVEDAASGLETRDQSTVDAVTTSVAQWLTSNGHAVHEVSAPPFRHPHQNQTDTIINLFLAFAFAALSLAAILVASTLGGMLAAQTRQIGIMKTVGASTATIVGLYLAMTSSIAAVATLLALVPGIVAGRSLAGLVGTILNFDISSEPVGAGTLALIVAVGILTPVLVGMLPIVRAARVTVREAISDFEVSKTGTRRIDRILARLGAGDRLVGFAVRGLGRRPRRFIATVALLATGGALFLAGINSSAAWERWVEEGLSRRSYDVQLGFALPVPQAALDAALDGAEGVEGWESLSSLPATPSDDNGVRIQRIYPDGGHGLFAATAIDADTEFVDFAVRSGHWLRTGEQDAVVLNQTAARRLGDPQVGDTAALSIEGHRVEWTIVGIIDEVGGPATAYVDRAALDGALGSSGLATAVRIVGDNGSARVIAALEAEGIDVSSIVPTTELEKAIDNHVVVFIAVLIALAILMAIIGALGLASSMSMSVIERTREFGIMKAIGASPGFVRRLVLSEGALTGAIGLVIAALLAVPVTALVGSTLGRLAFGLPLPLVISIPALLIWLIIAVLGAVLASFAAAQRSAGLSVRESLSHQ
jgi:putative ABC transport system permease protein